MAPSEQSINLPQILVLTIVGFLAVRWYFSSRAAPSTGGSSSSSSSGNRINPAHVEQIMQMFPQLDRRTVMWELQKSGGSVALVTEKVLMGRALETPPQTFQPPMPAPATAPAARPAAPAQPKSTHPDLITKYNLSSRLSEAAADGSSDKGKQSAWSANKSERQSNLQKRREEMILAARRKMEEQDKAKAGSSS